MLTSGFSGGRSNERGTALVEFALVLPFLLILTIMVVDFGRAFYTKNILVTSVREGVRYLAVNSVADADSVEARVRQVAELSGVTVNTVTVEELGEDQVQVTAEASFDWLYPGLLTWLGVTYTDPMSLSASAVMRDE